MHEHNEHVYKIIEVVGSSREGIEDAVRNAVSRTSESIRELRWFKLEDVRGQLKEGKVEYWQVSLRIGFNVEGG